MKKINLEDYLGDNVIVRQRTKISLGTPEECKGMFIEAFKITDKTVDKLDWLPEYDEVVEWMSDNKGKGLIMTGHVGRGKSSILSGVLPLIFKAKLNKIIRSIPARELHKVDRFGWSVCIEDMGADDVVNDWGTKIDGVEIAISHCEDRMKLLLITTNLNSRQITTKYDERIMDRIHRLCKVVVFDGKSYRK